MAQHASNDIKDDAVPLLADDATGNTIVKLKREVTAKIVLSKSMQVKPVAATQDVKDIKKALAITNDESDMISAQMELAMMQMITTYEAFIRVNANSSPTSTFETNSSNCIFNIKTTRLLTFDAPRTLDAITFFLSTLHCHFGASAQEVGLRDKLGIVLKNGWAAVGLLQFCNNSAEWANDGLASMPAQPQLEETAPPWSMRPLSLPML